MNALETLSGEVQDGTTFSQGKTIQHANTDKNPRTVNTAFWANKQTKENTSSVQQRGAA